MYLIIVLRKLRSSLLTHFSFGFCFADYTIKKISNLNLPTAPRAACDLVIDESKIPANGPFMAYLSNLPYEITEDDIALQFKELKVR